MPTITHDIAEFLTEYYGRMYPKMPITPFIEMKNSIEYYAEISVDRLVGDPDNPTKEEVVKAVLNVCALAGITPPVRRAGYEHITL